MSVYRGGEQHFKPILRGPLTTETASGPSQWSGRINISSGDVTVTVSTTLVNSDSLIFAQIEGNINQSSGVAAPIEVCSIVSGSHFTLTRADGTATTRTVPVMWMLMRAS